MVHAQDKTILVVEDEPDVRMFLEACAEDAGFQVHTAEDGIDALERLASLTPDLITLDMVMPRMNGLAFLRKLRANPDWEAIPVILITAHLRDELGDEAVRQLLAFPRGHRPKLVLEKPINPPELRAPVRRAAGRGHRRRGHPPGHQPGEPHRPRPHPRHRNPPSHQRPVADRVSRSSHSRRQSPIRALGPMGAVVITGLLVIAHTTSAAAQNAPPPPGCIPPDAPVRCRGESTSPPIQLGSDNRKTPPAPRDDWGIRIYFGWGYSGFTAIVSGEGPFGKLKPGFTTSAWVGLRFTPRWAAEIGFSGSLHANRAGDIVFEDRASLVGVNASLRYYMAPRWRVFVPYLLAGAVFNALSTTAWSRARDVLSLNVIGGGFQVGGGFDIHIHRLFTLGMRLKYRVIFLDKPACDAYDKPCVDPVYEMPSWTRAVTGELTLGLVF